MASTKTPVYLVQLGRSCLPLSLGMLHAHARAGEGGALRDRLDLRFVLSPGPDTVRSAPPGIWLFPDYLWSFDFNMDVSRAVAERGAGDVTVHGGPSAPKYPEACDRFLHERPHADVVVRGEGEVTAFHLLDHLAGAFERRRDWRDGLERIEGLSFLAAPGGATIRTPDRPRLADLDVLASPYLDGSFDAWMQPRIRLTTIETNRGCPYGCTFCDWGSATQQKIHAFDLDRVKAEIEWLASHRIPVMFLADANFGLFDRDVEIAEHIGAMRSRYGFPKELVVSYAKNGNDRIPAIVSAMVKSGVVTEGVISIQTQDPNALRAVRRSNIKTRNYEKLITVYRQQGLPVSTDLLVGLPGATLQSHKDDLQWCIDEDIVARCFPTFILPNSPMADPAYVREHKIRVRAGVIAATATASEADLAVVADFVALYGIVEKCTLLRYVARHLQWRHGLRASDLLHSLAVDLKRRPDAFPAYLRALERNVCLNGVMADPDAFYEAIWRHVRDVVGIPLGAEEDRVVWQLNAAVVPRRGVTYPIRVESPWDVLGYFGSCVAPAPGEARSLRRLERPQCFEIADPEGYATTDFEKSLLVNSALRLFELDWPLRQRASLSVIYDEPDQAERARALRRAALSRSSPVDGLVDA